MLKYFFLLRNLLCKLFVDKFLAIKIHPVVLQQSN